MLTLTVDTSSLRGSVALFKDRSLVGTRSWSRLNSHCELLSSMTDEILVDSKTDLKNINRLAVGLGPGSFTGIRVGVNFIRTLAYSLNLNVFALNSLQLLASQVQSSEWPICCMQYGFRDLVYVAKYQLDKGRVYEISPPHVKSIEQIINELQHPHLVIGSGYEPCKSVAQQHQLKNFVRSPHLQDDPDATFFVNSAALDQSQSQLSSWPSIIPLYIRASEAEEKMKSGALSPS